MRWRDYWKTNLGRSFENWGRNEALLAFLVYACTALFAFIGTTQFVQNIGAAILLGIAIAAVVWLLGLVLFITPARIWTGDQAEIGGFKRLQQPRLALVFKPIEGRPYVQDLRFMAGPDRWLLQRYFRIGVQNLSSLMIPGVRLVLESCEPSSRQVFPEHSFGLSGTGVEFFDLNPGDKPTAYVDVLRALLPIADERADPSSVFSLELVYQVSSLQQGAGNLPVTDQHVVVRAEGGHTYVRAKFDLQVTAANVEVVGFTSP